MIHLSKDDVIERVEKIIESLKGQDWSNITLPVVVYIQVSGMLGDITADEAKQLSMEYLTRLTPPPKKKK